MAWLAAPHGRRAAERGEDHAAQLVEAAPAESHWHPRRPPADRIDLGAGPPPQGHGRLQGLAALKARRPLRPEDAGIESVPLRLRPRPSPAPFCVLTGAMSRNRLTAALVAAAFAL